MPYVVVRYSDGEYDARAVLDTEVEKLRGLGCKLALIQDDTWVAWMNHRRAHAAWQEFWLMHDNAAFEERAKAERIWVVFRVPGMMDEVRQGPFEKHEYGRAAEARKHAQVTFDSRAHYINELGERKESL